MGGSINRLGNTKAIMGTTGTTPLERLEPPLWIDFFVVAGCCWDMKERRVCLDLTPEFNSTTKNDTFLVTE
jgi:hypothetical protein